jgi:hypothetical protein
MAKQSFDYQVVYDTVLFALREQKVASSDADACRYRGPNTRKCAAGHLLPDELYHLDMEGQVLTESLVRTAFDKVWKKPLSDKQRTFLLKLQNAHDNHMPRYLEGGESDFRIWNMAMHRIADEYHLHYTPIPC